MTILIKNRLFSCTCVLLLCLAIVSCESTTLNTSSQGGEGSPCLDDIDCQDGLVCIDKTCTTKTMILMDGDALDQEDEENESAENDKENQISDGDSGDRDLVEENENTDKDFAESNADGDNDDELDDDSEKDVTNENDYDFPTLDGDIAENDYTEIDNELPEIDHLTDNEVPENDLDLPENDTIFPDGDIDEAIIENDISDIDIIDIDINEVEITDIVDVIDGETIPEISDFEIEQELEEETTETEIDSDFQENEVSHGKICVNPGSTIDFGQKNSSDIKTKKVKLTNCGSSVVEICEVSLKAGSQTPHNSFSLSNFSPFFPHATQCFFLTSGTSANELSFDLKYLQTQYGKHNAVIGIYAVSSGINVNEYIDVKGLVSSCQNNYWDLNPDIPGCEYYCEFQDSIDLPDMNFVDSNCDGIDGEVDNSIFVSLDGDDANDGSVDHPKLTIKSALFTAKIKNIPSVIISTGSYNEEVTIQNGVNIYGGYSRNITNNEHPLGWVRSEYHEVQILSPTHIGLKAPNISIQTKLQLLTIRANDGTNTDLSSYGIYAGNADNLILDNLTVYSGNGHTGADGTAIGQQGKDGKKGENGDDGREDDTGIYCNKSNQPDHGDRGESDCGRSGGDGGDSCKPITGVTTSCTGDDGKASSNGTPGGTGQLGNYGKDGTDGANGSDGGHGAGATNKGVVSNNFWYSNNGQNGDSGTHGYGGGGGAGGGSVLPYYACEDWGGAGGGGGGGGCAGGGGDGGYGGGGSFAIFLYSSSPIITDCYLETGNGGNGGKGKAGGLGGEKGEGGDGGSGFDDSSAGGDGGDGGEGGDGGSGGGGQGGPSIGIYKVGTSNPSLLNITYDLGSYGNGGQAGSDYGNDGQDGFSLEIYKYE